MSDDTENKELWSSFSLANELSPAQRHRWRLVVNALEGLPPNGVVVDLGCGSGALLLRIASALPTARLVGIDMEPRALELARRRVPSAELFQGDLDAGIEVIRAERADAVVCSEVLEHLAMPERALRLAREVLRPGGRVVVTVPAGAINHFDRTIGHRKHYRPDELTLLLTGAGFDDVRTVAWGFPFHTLFRIALAMAPGSTEGFRDEKIGVLHRSLFSLLNALFYLNIRSGRFGRQLIATGRRE